MESFIPKGYEQGNVEYGIYDLGHREACKNGRMLKMHIGIF